MSDEAQDALKHFHMKVGGEEVDFSGLAPITVGDKKRLKAVGIDFLKYARERTLDPDDEAKLVLYVCRKLRPQTTPEEIDELPALHAASLMQFMMKKSTEVDDPFSTRSTSSEQPTVGASAKSDNAPSTS